MRFINVDQKYKNTKTDTIPLNWVIRQGDTITCELFTFELEHIF